MSFDMGGTTAKACLIQDRRPLIAGTFEVDRRYRFKPGSDLPVTVPAIDMIEIGAGGGSIASVDALGLLTVGPESAGSEPGPVCYGRGGVEPTVTDADLVLGLLNAENFLGGEMRLDAEGAVKAIEALAAKLEAETEDELMHEDDEEIDHLDRLLEEPSTVAAEVENDTFQTAAAFAKVGDQLLQPGGGI